MSKITAAITGINGYVPDYVMTNDELATMVDTNDEWIVSRTGIKERRILRGSGKGVSIMAVEAVKGLLEKTHTAPEEIDGTPGQQTDGQGFIAQDEVTTHTVNA